MLDHPYGHISHYDRRVWSVRSPVGRFPTKKQPFSILCVPDVVVYFTSAGRLGALVSSMRTPAPIQSQGSGPHRVFDFSLFRSLAVLIPSYYIRVLLA